MYTIWEEQSTCRNVEGYRKITENEDFEAAQEIAKRLVPSFDGLIVIVDNGIIVDEYSS